MVIHSLHIRLFYAPYLYIIDAKAQIVLRVLVEYFCHIFGFPTSILSDNGSHFKNQEFQDFGHKLRINHLFTSPENDQSN